MCLTLLKSFTSLCLFERKLALNDENALEVDLGAKACFLSSTTGQCKAQIEKSPGTIIKSTTEIRCADFSIRPLGIDKLISLDQQLFHCWK